MYEIVVGKKYSHIYWCNVRCSSVVCHPNIYLGPPVIIHYSVLWNIFQVFHCVHFECPAQSEETSVIVTSVRDDAGVASHSKNILSSSTGVNRTAQVSENDEASDGEATINHDHQYQATFQEDNKATAPQP